MISLLVLGVFIGWFLREIRQILLDIKGNIGKQEEKPEEHKPSTGFGDVMTPAEMAAIENKERIARLNR